MHKLLPFAFALVISSAASAQNWTVGVPVDLTYYSQPMFGGCSPQPDYTFLLPSSPVDGVNYLLKVVTMSDPAGELVVEPGGVLGLGDVLVIEEGVQRSFTLTGGATTATLEWRVVGTPVTPGQMHPCAASDFWMSNMMFCPEGLIPVINNDCTVQVGTAIGEAQEHGTPKTWITASDGLLHLQPGSQGQLEVLDLTGKRLLDMPVHDTVIIPFTGFPAGIYLAILTEGNTRKVSRFLVE